MRGNKHPFFSSSIAQGCTFSLAAKRSVATRTSANWTPTSLTPLPSFTLRHEHSTGAFLLGGGAGGGSEMVRRDRDGGLSTRDGLLPGRVGCKPSGLVAGASLRGGGAWGARPPPPKSWVPKSSQGGTLMICPKFEISGVPPPPKLVRPSRNFFPATSLISGYQIDIAQVDGYRKN